MDYQSKNELFWRYFEIKFIESAWFCFRASRIMVIIQQSEGRLSDLKHLAVIIHTLGSAALSTSLHNTCNFTSQLTFHYLPLRLRQHGPLKQPPLLF